MLNFWHTKRVTDPDKTVTADITSYLKENYAYLTTPQVITVQLALRGYKPKDIAEELCSGNYEELPQGYTISDRQVRNWLDLPQVQAAIASCEEQTVKMMRKFEVERVKAVLPDTSDRLIKMIPKALDTLERVLEGEGGKSAMAMLKGVQMVFDYSGVFQTEKTLHGEERSTSSQGLTAEKAELIRKRILMGDREVAIQAEKQKQQDTHKELDKLAEEGDWEKYEETIEILATES